MSLARWESLKNTYPFIQPLKTFISVVYSLDSNRPRYKLSNPRAFMAWAETRLGYTTEDLQRLEILIFQDITRG